MELYDGEVLLSGAEFALDSRWSQHRIALDVLAARPADRPLRLALRTTSPYGALIGNPRVLSGPRPESAGPPRTVTLITSDTHRADHVGYAPGGAGVRTPNLDRLAAEGACFTRANAVTSITNPSHATIFTGRHVRDTGIIGNLVPLAEAARTVAEEFEAAGFRTIAAVSARHLMPWRSGFGQGFERFGAPDKRMTRHGAETLDEARAMLADAADHDVFLWLHLFEAHAPYEPQKATELYYQGDPYSEEHGELGVEIKPQWNKRIRDERYIRALYKGEVSQVDRLLGSFFARVPRVRSGHVLFTADHGESLGENGIYWEHTGIYPSTLEVPLVLTGPGIPAGTVVDDPVSHEDVARTLLELGGLLGTATGTTIPGRSLLETIGRGSAPRAPRFVIGSGGMSAGVFSEQWYLLLHIETKAWGNPPGPARHSIELYDRGPDPGCTRNVVAEHPDVARRLREVLVQWLAHPAEDGGLAGSLTSSTIAREDIAALGYAADEKSALDGALIDPECPCAVCAQYR
jgi:arylsulfatase A-like enzyme